MNDWMQRFADGVVAEIGSVLVNVAVTCFSRLLRINSKTKEELFNEKDLKDFKLDNLKELTKILLKEGELSTNDFLKMKNLIEIADIADKHFMKQHHNGEHKEDFQNINWDWMMRFFDAVGNISDKELHILWAKILAGELSKKNSFSLRAIDILKNFSVEDARRFHKICNHSFERGNSVFVPSYDDFCSYAGITFDDILALDDLGLVNNNGTFNLNLSCKQEVDITVFNCHFALIANKKNSSILESYPIKVYRFTALGKELRSTMEFENPDEDLFTLRDCLRKNIDKKDINFSVHKVNSIKDYEIKYEIVEIDNVD